MNDLVEKIKSLFSKEGEGNKKIMFIVLFLVAFFAYNIFNSFKSKDQGNVASVNNTEEVNNINSTDNEILKEKAEEAKKKDLEKSGIAFKDEKPEENKQDQTDKQSQQNQQQVQQQVQQPDYLNSSLNDPLLVKQQQDDKELKKMQLEIQKKQLEMQEQMIKVSMENQMKAWALDQIGKPVSYGSDDKGKDTTNSNANVGINNQLEMQGQASAEVYDLEGTIMDDLRMPVGSKRIARINTEKGLILIGATATPTGIVFDNNATMIKNGKKIPVYVQITDKDGNSNLLTYVINKRNEVVSKVAFLSFLQGFAEGMVKSQITTSVGALGPVNSNIVEGGLRTGLARGASSGVNAYVQEENRNLSNLVNTIVLLKGEKVKIMVVEGGV